MISPANHSMSMTAKRKSPLPSVKRRKLLHQTAQTEIKKYIITNSLVVGGALPQSRSWRISLGSVER